MKKVQLVPHLPSLDQRKTIAVQYSKNNHKLVLLYQIQGFNKSCPKNEILKRGNELWKQDCVEAFWHIGTQKKYCELNVNIQNEWEIYEFKDYRLGMVASDKYRVKEVRYLQNDPGQLQIKVIVSGFTDHDLRNIFCSFSAILYNDLNSISHWSNKHLLDHADFHQRESRLLYL